MLRLDRVRKTFFGGTINERIALDGVDVELGAGEFVTVIGSNGAGKSTLLNVIAGKLYPEEGTVWIEDEDVSQMPEHARAAYVGRVFQDPMAGTSPGMSIEENLAIAYHRGRRRLLSRGVTGKKREFFYERLKTLELGLEDRLKTKVGLLSGGQRQALSLLMATFTSPRILLLDEHTAALDPRQAELVTRLTEEIVTGNGLTTIMVTHNMEQALQLGHRLIMMHEGKIILDIAGERKQSMAVGDLIEAFRRVRGEEFAEDRHVLQ